LKIGKREEKGRKGTYQGRHIKKFLMLSGRRGEHWRALLDLNNNLPEAGRGEEGGEGKRLSKRLKGFLRPTSAIAKKERRMPLPIRGFEPPLDQQREEE